MEDKLPKQPTTTMDKLPEEVISDILIRLPAKRLAQFRCVSKPFNALLSHPSFIKSHLHRSIHNNPETLLVFYDGFCFEGGKPITARPSHSPHIQTHNFVKLPEALSIPPGYTHSSVVGSLNGLICFALWATRRDPIICVWNPSLNALRVLPPYTVPLLFCIDPAVDLHLRFGYDPETDDYKVVKFAKLFQQGKPTRSWIQVEMYSMRFGSWKIINDKFPSRATWFADDMYLFFIGSDGHDGRIHWLCHLTVGRGLKQAIVAFDLASETFSEISLPDSIQETKNDTRKVLGNLDGKLCVMSYVKDHDIEVYVMNEYGVAESWVKHHVFSQFSSNVFPLGFTMNNEFLLEGDNNRLALYDHVAAKVKSFKIIIAKRRYNYDRVKIVSYVDSLVWIAPAN